MTGWIVETLIASTLLMLAVLALRGPVARRWGATAAYALWLLPALRMILPPIPAAPEPIRELTLRIDVSRLAVETPVPAAPIAGTAAATPVDWVGLALAVWLAGAIAYLAWQVARHRRFMAATGRQAGLTVPSGRIAIHRRSGVGGPLATGLFRRHILLPADFMARYTATERRLALLHELAHHRRGDLIANFAALLMLSLHWFNPIAHRAYRAFRADQEQACDATVLRPRPGCAHAYGTALVKSALARTPAAACALGTSTEIKERLKMIAQFAPGRPHRRIGAWIAATAVLGGLTLTASGGIAAPSVIAPVIPTAPVLAARFTTPPVPPVPPEAATPPAAPRAPAAPAYPAVHERHGASAGHARPPAAAQAAEEARRAGLAAAEAGRAAAEAGAVAAEQARHAVRARYALSDASIHATVESAMAEARADISRECASAVTARGPVAQAGHGCVSAREINAQVAAGLRAAIAGLKADGGMGDDIRMRIAASLDRAATRLERKAD